MPTISERHAPTRSNLLRRATGQALALSCFGELWRASVFRVGGWGAGGVGAAAGVGAARVLGLLRLGGSGCAPGVLYQVAARALGAVEGRVGGE